LGEIVAGGNGKGVALNQLNGPRYIKLGNDNSLYIAETGNDRVTRWLLGSDLGEIVAGGNGKGSLLNQLNSPSGIILEPDNSL